MSPNGDVSAQDVHSSNGGALFVNDAQGESSTAGTGQDDSAAKNGKRKKCLNFK